MYSEKITFVLFMFNEEARVERAVRNFIRHGRVLVVDCFSTDRTCEIATGLGAEILKYQNQGWVEDEHTTALIKETVKTPWLYWGFSDEIVDCETMDAMLAAVESGRYGIVNIARKNYYYGRFCHEAYMNRQPRAFKKDAVDFRGNKIHHFGKTTIPESEICYLDPDKYFVHHFISNTAKVYLGSIDKYTEIEARSLPERTPLGVIARLFKHFFISYVVHGGWKAGRAGFYLTLQMAYYQMLLAMKLHENKNGLDTRGIEALNNEVRDRLLAEMRSAP